MDFGNIATADEHDSPRRDPVRVAFDVGFTAEARLQGNPVFGIARAVEAWLSGLAEQPEVDLRLIGMCGDDPLFRSAAAVEYAASNFPEIYALPGVGRTGGALTRRITSAYMKHRIRSASGLKPTLVRHALRPVKIVARRRKHISIDADLFHCSFYPLPSGGEPLDVPRLMNVYDMIPITYPDEYPTAVKDMNRAVIDSIRPERDFAVCISEFVRSELLRLTPIPPSRVYAVPLGVSKEFRLIEGPEVRQRLSERYGIPAEKPFILNLATYQPRKNLSLLINAFAQWVTDHGDRNLQLVLAGQRNSAHNLLLRPLSKPLASRVHFTGTIAEGDMPSLYSAAQVFVFPSLAEGFGLPPLEAMACGLPVIASGLTSLPEVIGDAGLLFDPHESGSLLRILNQFFDDKSIAPRMRERGLSRAEQFRWSISVRRLIDVYRTVIDDYPQIPKKH